MIHYTSIHRWVPAQEGPAILWVHHGPLPLQNCLYQSVTLWWLLAILCVSFSTAATRDPAKTRQRLKETLLREVALKGKLAFLLHDFDHAWASPNPRKRDALPKGGFVAWNGQFPIGLVWVFPLARETCFYCSSISQLGAQKPDKSSGREVTDHNMNDVFHGSGIHKSLENSADDSLAGKTQIAETSATGCVLAAADTQRVRCITG